MTKLFICLFFCVNSVAYAQLTQQDTDLLQLIQSFSKTSSVTGRENESAAFVQSLFAAGTVKKDKMGNLILTLGSGSPKRLFVAPLDKPGYVVSVSVAGSLHPCGR